MKKALIVFIATLISSISFANEGIIDEGFALESSLWETFAIPVCWDNPEGAPAEERAWIKDAVSRTWEAYSQVKFTGWGACNSDSNGIHIYIDDVGPHVKRLGKGLDGFVNGMVLNFTYEHWSTSCRSRRQYCSEVIAVHEFGHALGFAHEQNREDTPDTCTDDPQGTDGDILIGAWDLNSVMNYCNPEWNGAGQLSDTDIEMVQLFYGSSADEYLVAQVCGIPTASSDDGNIAQNTLDGDLETRWSAQGEGEWIEYNLCDAATLSSLDIAWFKGDVRNSIFDIDLRLGDGDYVKVFSGSSYGASTEPLSYSFNDTLADTVRITGYGNTLNSWNSITEVSIIASSTETFELLQAENFTAEATGPHSIELNWVDNSTGEDGYIIEASIDNENNFTFVGMTAENATQFIHEDLTAATTYNYRLMSYKGTEYSASTSGTAITLNDTSNIEIISGVSSSASTDDGNIAENTLDKDLSTRWSGNGVGAYIDFDLGQVYKVGEIQAAFYKGDQRTSTFYIYSSMDGINWSLEASGSSSGDTLELETLAPAQLSITQARYIRIVGQGNSLNTWNSIAEVEFLGERLN